MRRFILLAWIVLPAPASAELVALQNIRRAPFADGKSFGTVGPYEIIRADGVFQLDPKIGRNERIVDLDLAPKNAKGMVEFISEIVILAPKDPAKGNGALFYDVNNRGNKLALRFFNLGPGGNDVTRKGSEGDGFLMEQGYTVVWSGWIGELWPGDDRLRLIAPPVLEDGKPVRGIVRFEMFCDKPTDTLPISRRDNHATYTPMKDAVLTVRDGPHGKRETIPRDRWTIATTESKEAGHPRKTLLQLKGGFTPGRLYELIAECEGAYVQGTGFAAVRDLISFLRHDESADNPLRRKDGKPANSRALSFGVSQSGRFLRHLLYQGFNEDEKGRIVFDGLMPHVAGGGLGFFNHRFAQPTRHNSELDDHDYPADVFPFTYGPATDPFRKIEDSILGAYAKSKQQPKVMHTQTAAEYWHRSGSLVHTDPMAREDAVIPENVRIYAFGGAQHGPAADPPSRGIGDNLNNPADYRPFLRALLLALDDWAKEGKTPPASVYPKLADKTLVPFEQKDAGFPDIPGVRYPTVIQTPDFRDYGKDFAKTGIITREPPDILGQYAVRVPKSDPDGNDLGTLLLPDVAVPLATYTGWNLRRKEFGADGQLVSLIGSYIPFTKTKAEREKAGDPRASIGERYGTLAKYLERYRRAGEALVDQRFLTAEDARRLIARARKRGEWFGEK
ncbi:MAG: alpha/beta hydrolase domain-containing protein [Gemmataceae bacterium]